MRRRRERGGEEKSKRDRDKEDRKKGKQVELGKKGSPEERRREKIYSYFEVMGRRREGSQEEGRKRGREGGDEEGGITPVPVMNTGVFGSLSRGGGRRTSIPSPKPKKRGKGLLGIGKKEGSSKILRDWLLREQKAAEEATKGQGRTEEGGGKK